VSGDDAAAGGAGEGPAADRGVPAVQRRRPGAGVHVQDGLRLPDVRGEAVSSRWWMPVLLVLAVAGSMAVALVFAYALLAVVAFVGWL
jgi:hypothetical protein